MNRVDATMAIEFAVLGTLFMPLAMLLGAAGIGGFRIFLMRVAGGHCSSR